MTVRTDIFVRPELSPRVIVVQDPSTELVLQDLHDTMCAWQDTPVNHAYDVIIASAGKEALGGSVFVGITTTLQNAVVQFEARTTPSETGTVTTPDASGLILTDSAAAFLTTAVQGSIVLNSTDGSKATIVEVISDTAVRTDGLSGGTDDQWDSPDAYEVFPVVACNISGGNLVAIDDVGGDIASTLSSFGTQIVRTSSSSATLQELQDIQFASFNGAVEVDVLNGSPGTLYPAGTARQRCDNFTDALAIASERGFTKLRIIGDAAIDSGLDYRNFQIEGESPTKTLLTVSSAAQVDNAEFSNATIAGTLDGGSSIVDCRINSLAFVDGFVTGCVLVGPITLSGVDVAHFLDCWSGIPGSGSPTIDMGGSGSALGLRHYNGGVTLTNKTGSDAISIDLNSGKVVLDSSVTDGDIVIRGIGKLEDNSGGTAVVNSEDLISGRDLTVLNERVARRIEGLRDNHQALGTDYYVDPVNGNDSNDGLLPDNAFATVTAAMAVVTSGANDVIWIENRSGGPANLTERITITKNRVLIRGPGLNTSITNPDDADACIIVDGGGVQLAGFRMLPAVGASQPLIRHTGKDHFRCENLQLIDSTGVGIYVTGGDAHVFDNVEIGRAAGAGMHLVDTTHTKILQATIYEGAVEGIRLGNTGASKHLGTVIGHETVCHKNTGVGLIIDADTAGTVIHNSVHLDSYTDNGTGTTHEPDLRQDRVWDVLSASPDAGSVKELLLRLYQLAGLDPTNPLEVTDTTRRVPANGSIIDQTVADNGTTTTVTRI